MEGLRQGRHKGVAALTTRQAFIAGVALLVGSFLIWMVTWDDPGLFYFVPWITYPTGAGFVIRVIFDRLRGTPVVMWSAVALWGIVAGWVIPELLVWAVRVSR